MTTRRSGKQLTRKSSSEQIRSSFSSKALRKSGQVRRQSNSIRLANMKSEAELEEQKRQQVIQENLAGNKAAHKAKLAGEDEEAARSKAIAEIRKNRQDLDAEYQKKLAAERAEAELEEEEEFAR